MKTFASDNYAGVLPEVMEALTMANHAHASSYGYDPVTQKAVERFRELFGKNVQVRFVFNGTGANVLSLALATQPCSAVVCASTSHIYNSESTAPESFTGCRLIAIPADYQGKMTLEAIEQVISEKKDEHSAQIKAFSLSQATEYGTLYTINELKAIGQLLSAHQVYFHVDGSRLLNAAEHMRCTLQEMITETGVDILSLGGTKSGLMFGEAVVILNEALGNAMLNQHKRSMQLASKNRFIAAQFDALLKDGVWQRYAGHANRMAQILQDQIKHIPGVHITKKVQTNVVFATLPPDWIRPLQETIPFYVWDARIHEVRLMCAFDTTEAEIHLLADRLKQLAGKA